MITLTSPPANRPSRLLADIWKMKWPLLAFALSFQLLENLLFTPTMGLIGKFLQGRPAVDSTALVQFFLSPRGFLVLFLGAVVSLTIRLVENAGLSAMVLGALEGKTFRAFAAFRWLLEELPRLAVVGARIVAWGVGARDAAAGSRRGASPSAAE